MTGGARRIGRALALALAHDGWSVTVHHKSSAKDASGVVGEIETMGGHAAALHADLEDAEETAGLVAAAGKGLGPLTLLVNNASIFERDELASMTGEGWTSHMTANLRAPAFLSQAFAAQLPEDADGNIVNIIDQRVWAPTPLFFSYTLSKMALWDMTLANARQSAADFNRQTGNTILGQGTTPEEICTALRFILAAPAMTGQMIALDGGQHLAWETPDVTGISE